MSNHHSFFFLALVGLLFLSSISDSYAQPTEADSLTHIKMIFSGDIMGHGPQIQSAQRVRNKQYDYTPCFRYVQPLLEEADLAIGNLEVTLPGKPPYQGYPMFRSPDALADALRQAGFDFLVTANNHSNDAGKQGVLHTIEALRKNQFYQTGTFNNRKERDLLYPLLVYKQGIKLAFLNYTYDTNKHRTVPPTMVNEIDTVLIKQDMAEALRLKPDAIIVLMHWGSEDHLKESRKQRRLARKLFSWGANLIIGSHPHVVQPIYEHQLPQKDGTLKKHTVAYSLGNFISNQTKPNTNGGILVEIEMIKDKTTGKTWLGNYQYIPIWRCIHEEKKGKKTYFALPISAIENNEKLLPNMSKANQKAMDDFAAFIRDHLGEAKERKLDIKVSEIKY